MMKRLVQVQLMTELAWTRKYRSESSKMEEHIPSVRCRHLLLRNIIDKMYDMQEHVGICKKEYRETHLKSQWYLAL